MLEEHIDELHKLSVILIERETIDKDQFERLLAGEAEEDVFAEEQPARRARAGPRARAASRAPKPKPFPLPGATMQPPPPEPEPS